MKKISLVLLVSFLMVLYIGPSILAPSLMRTPILTEQNTSKDFLVASEPWLFWWDYRRAIDIIGSVGAGTNYQVNLTVDWITGMQNDWDDIRFTDDDKITELDYWMEYYIYGMGEDKYAWFWVEVKDNLDTNQTIYMYYGNDAVSTTSNGSTTFPSLYEDWSSQSIRAEVWDIAHSDGGITYSAVDANHGYTAQIEADAGDSYMITTDYDNCANLSVMFRAYIEDPTTGNYGVIGSGWIGAYGWSLVELGPAADRFYVHDDDGNADHQAMDAIYDDTWITWDITRDGTNAKLYADGVLIETASFDPDIVDTNPAASIRVIDSEDDLYSDWILVRKFIAIEPAFHDLGEEENAPIPEWVDVGSAPFLFHVGWDPVFQFGFDAFLIFLGLIMIPVSTMYLVRGGRDEMSSEKLFYGLLIFAIGFGLLVGGIMP